MHEHTLSIRQAATDTLKMPQGRTLQICFKSHQSLMWCGEWQNSCMHSITAAEVDSRGGASHWVRICCIDMEANRQNTKQVAEEKQETENNSWRYFQIETESEGKKKKKIEKSRYGDEAHFLQLSWGGSMLRWGFCVLPCWQWQRHGQTGLIQRYHVNSNPVNTLSSLRW